MPLPPNLSALIFLDYDGVLQTPKLSYWREFEYLPALESILRDYPDVGIVVSSTHRFGRTPETLRMPYAPDIRPRVLGGTPDLVCGDADGGRFDEIRQWLDDNCAAHMPWVALDDERRRFPDECANLMWVSPYGGFDDFQEEELRERLDGLLAQPAATSLQP